MNPKVIAALFRRNFISYFSSPIGYVFICAFVLMGAFAAFWPSEFFNANLANLDQLNKYLPWIMLVFIPAITMGIWADERRQGTDELLLTLPANDLDVVLGKYLAALAIFTIALLFSLSNVLVLQYLANPDWGLLAANIAGYWLVGAAMIAAGMVASFLTNNLTVGFILAVAFNAPLVFAAWSDSIIPWPSVARFIRGLSISEQFRDFGRGVISLSSVVFFLSIIAVMLYLNMVLIGRRHWQNNPGRPHMGAHFLARTLALAAIAVGVNVLAVRFDVRLDASSERLSSLAPQTRTILSSLKTERPVYIEAYVSPDVPEQYVQTRLNLLSTLREVDALGGDKVVVRVTNTERFSPEATQAQEQFNITARQVSTSVGGRFAVDQIFLGAAVMCGLDKVVIPFFDVGTPVEYELLRSIATVSQQKRKTLGVVETDAQLLGGFDMNTMSTRQDEPIIAELKQQYEVTRVNPETPIEQKFDVLMAVQPSSLPQKQQSNLIAAIRAGQPTVIFEDPFPAPGSGAPPTSQPRMPSGGNNPFRQQQMPEPKGDIVLLWQLLQINFTDRQIVWQDYNPYPKIGELPREYVFVSPIMGGPEAFSQSSLSTRGLRQLLMAFPGALSPRDGSTMTFTPLLRAGSKTGLMPFEQILERDMFGRLSLNTLRRFQPTNQPYTLAARIRGTPPGEGAMPIDVAVVADLDLLDETFFELRARGERRDAPMTIRLDNVAFALNLLDEMAGDDRFIEVRKRQPIHRTLTTVEKETESIREEADRQREDFLTEFEQKRADQEKQFQADIDKLNARQGIDAKTMLQEVAIAQQSNQTRLQAVTERLQRDRDRQVEKTETDLAVKVRHVQDTYKFAAVALPPIPPLIVAVFVFFIRRGQERIGIPRQRLR